jgi:hypothetical protein
VEKAGSQPEQSVEARAVDFDRAAEGFRGARPFAQVPEAYRQIEVRGRMTRLDLRELC